MFVAVWVSLPLSGSTAKTATLFVSILHEIRNFPEGARQKNRGCLPPLGTFWINANFPPIGSAEKTAMESSPRLETYKNLPSADVSISAVEFFDLSVPSGNVETS